MEKLLLKCNTTGPDEQDFCADGYTLEIQRNDGLGISEMELRSMLTQTVWALEGDTAASVLVERGDIGPGYIIK
jgi:hypothetical protein